VPVLNNLEPSYNVLAAVVLALGPLSLPYETASLSDVCAATHLDQEQSV
jgi:hypothetical protein